MKKKIAQRIRLKTNGFEERRRRWIVAARTKRPSLIRGRLAGVGNSRGCFVMFNTSEVSVLISHHFLSLYIHLSSSRELARAKTIP